MGLAIYVPDIQPADAPLLSTVLELTCDGAHGFSGATVAEFLQDGYIAQRAAASKAGWKFSSDGRIFGPCCSGKVREDAE